MCFRLTSIVLYIVRTLSHSFCSSFMAAGDSRSGRMDSACPSLMYAGPRLVMMLRSWIARFTYQAANRTMNSFTLRRRRLHHKRMFSRNCRMLWRQH